MEANGRAEEQRRILCGEIRYHEINGSGWFERVPDETGGLIPRTCFLVHSDEIW